MLLLELLQDPGLATRPASGLSFVKSTVLTWERAHSMKSMAGQAKGPGMLQI